MNFLAFAINNARSEFGRPKPVKVDTHWTFYDEPERALCGVLVRPELVDARPTCAICQVEIERLEKKEIG